MSLSICLNCTTAGAPAAACPHCGSSDYFEEGLMPKNTVHGGSSNKTLPGPVVVEAAAEPEPAVEVVEDVPAVEVVPPSKYEPWLLVPLRDECVRRGLSKTGNKDELVARLVASDDTPAVEPAAVEEAPVVEEG